MSSMAMDATIGDPVIWHDAENGSYGADLDLWEGLAREVRGPVVDLGAGTGRVALHLARRGHDVIAVDTAPELLEALSRRAADLGVEVRTAALDARDLGASGLSAAAVFAPMQLAHLMGGLEGRRRLLEGALAVLPPGGRFHLALLEDTAEEDLGDETTPAPLPDVREEDGWLHSSLPTAVVFGRSGIDIHRLRELVSPAGELTSEDHLITLDYVSPDEFESEAEALGWIVLERTPIPLTQTHVGSVVVALEAPQ
jgi:SAM-dependent methyltransferase